MERADSPGEPLYMNSDGVRQIQQVLNQRGYAAGHLDGNWNNDTTVAATHFQQAQGLEPTGTLTTNLLASIGMPRWQRGELMGGMTTGANVPGNPNPQTTGTVSAERGPGPSARNAADGGSARGNPSAGQATAKDRARRAHDSRASSPNGNGRFLALPQPSLAGRRAGRAPSGTTSREDTDFEIPAQPVTIVEHALNGAHDERKCRRPAR